MNFFILCDDPKVIHEQFDNGLITNVFLPIKNIDMNTLKSLLAPILERGYLFKHVVIPLPSYDYKRKPSEDFTDKELELLFNEAKELRKLSRSITFKIPYSKLGVALNKKITKAGWDTMITDVNHPAQAFILSQYAPSLLMVSDGFFEQQGEILGNHFNEFKIPTQIVVDCYRELNSNNSKYIYGLLVEPINFW